MEIIKSLRKNELSFNNEFLQPISEHFGTVL